MAKITNFGRATFSLGAGKKFAILTGNGTATISQLNNSPNSPPLITETMQNQNTQVVYGPFTQNMQIAIDSLGDDVFYEIGSSPIVSIYKALSVDAVIKNVIAPPPPGGFVFSPGELFSQKILLNLGSNGQTINLPDGLSMDNSLLFNYLDSFQWSIINSTAFSCALSGNTGHAFNGSVAINANSSVRFETVKDIGVFVTYRIAG